MCPRFPDLIFRNHEVFTQDRDCDGRAHRVKAANAWDYILGVTCLLLVFLQKLLWLVVLALPKVPPTTLPTITEPVDPMNRRREGRSPTCLSSCSACLDMCVTPQPVV